MGKKNAKLFFLGVTLVPLLKRQAHPMLKKEKEYSTISLFKLLCVGSAAQSKQNIFVVHPLQFSSSFKY
jgi:hypothetical protein